MNYRSYAPQAITAFACLLALAAAGAASAQVLAFPEAEGFGRYATGARTNLGAASVYHVTNLNDAGPGSFRDAVSQSNRFVVFDVGGIVTLDSVLTFSSNVTIAGQTAPGGFVVFGDRTAFHGADNLISRHWSIHKGATSNRNDDAASIVRGNNLIFDHMSITWGTDGTFDINPDSGQVIDNMTIQNSIIGQGLDQVGHSTGGLMTPGDGGSISVIKSLYTDNVTRNPKVRNENEFINNVVYGYETAGYIMGDTSGTSYANVEGNYFIEGPVNGSSPFASGTSTFHIYANDNWVDGNRNGVLDGSLNTSYPGADVIATPHAFPTTASMTAQEAVAYVIKNAGPTITRDVVDTRIMQEVASYGTLGGVIVRETDLFPGYGTDPVYLNPRARLVDADNDGIADNWESAHGLNSANGADWKGLNGAGYTRLEEYVNELGADGATVASTGGAWTAPATWTGGAPTLADDAVSTGTLTHGSGQAFAQRLTVNGSLNVTGGTVDVFDTATFSAAGNITGGVVTAGRVLLGGIGQNGSLAVQNGGVLQSGTVAVTAGTGALTLNGGTFRATGAIDVKVPTTLGAGGGVIDTNGYAGQVTGAISGAGGLTKQGTGALTLSGPNSYAGPTVIEEGQVIAQGSGLGQTSGVMLGSGATLDVAAVPGGLALGAGKSLTGKGTVTGNVVAGAGAVVRPQGSLEIASHTIGIQAENLALGADWAIFDNALHGTGAGGSYDGSDLNGGGIVHVSGDRSGLAPIATGVAATSVQIPASGTWYLYAKTAEPAVSAIAGDPATQPGGNNSFFAAGSASTLQATTSSYEEIQTYANPGNAATWTLVSPTLSPLAGVNVPLNAGIDYTLWAGSKLFSIYGREVGTIIDGFVLADSNLTVAELEAALSGATGAGNERVLTIAGNYTHGVDATLQIDLAGSDSLSKLLVSGAATLGGDLAVTLTDGYVPLPGDVFTILDAASLSSQFANATPGARIGTSDGAGTFLVNYNYAAGSVSLSNFAAALPGDFNNDGTVNAADLAAWQEGFAPDGLDGGDFLQWQRNYGASIPVAAAVPEPAAALLALSALVGVLTAVRAKRTR
ncbi:MAG: autotransporter-associated beta strand repeat-containing protein [Planctomycetales bacterium]|nr:autotransporter-associated beta strand repeat-containing protein [Planctomycetales bacterium]